MKLKNLASLLSGCFGVCLFALGSGNAQAGDWVLQPISYSTPYTSVIGGTLGSLGYVSATSSGTGTSTSPYTVTVQSCVDVPSVVASANMIGSQIATWSGSGPSTPIMLHMTASCFGYYHDSATSETTITGKASGISGNYSIQAGSDTNYTYPTTFSFSPDVFEQNMNPSGTASGVVFTIAASCGVADIDGVTFATASAYFVPSAGSSGGGGDDAFNTRMSRMKQAICKKVVKRAATLGRPASR